MSILVVTYVGDGTSRFDRKTYDTHHIPLVQRTWEPFGLQRADVLHAVDVGDYPDVVAMTLCYFADRSGLDRALAAPQSAAVADDIASFTDISPMKTVVEAPGADDDAGPVDTA